MRTLLLALCLLGSVQAFAADVARPYVAIIIDDMGYRLEQDRKALSLDAPVAFSILPNTPGAPQILDAAKNKGYEVMLHLPMESDRPRQQQSPGTLTRSMSWINFVRTVQANLAAVPGLVAVNNHEGSRLTTDRQKMRWLMEELARHRIAFIDSRTTHHTVALETAHKLGLPAVRRDVFLDYAPGKIASQFDELISKAKKQGYALGIAHPHEETIRFLHKNIARLAQQGVELIPVSRYIMQRQQQSTPLLGGLQ